MFLCSCISVNRKCNFTVENMKIIMDYIKKYIDNGKVQVLTPRCAINDYYRVRHSDLLNLYKQV